MRPMVTLTCAVLIVAGVLSLVYVATHKPAAQPAAQPVAQTAAQTAAQPAALAEQAVSQSKTFSKESLMTPGGLATKDENPSTSRSTSRSTSKSTNIAGETPAHTVTADAVANGGVPLVLKLPPAMFVGTPPELKLAGIEVTTKQVPLMIPASVKLISLGKAVTASDNAPVIGELGFVTDGDKRGNDGCFVELAPTAQWVQINLGEPSEIFAIVMWHFHAQARVYHDVVVRCADDPDFTTGVKTLFNNDHDNSAGLGIGKDKEYLENNQGKLFDVCKSNGGQPVKARYLRFYSNGSTANEMNHYIEIEVYGRPAK